MRCHSYVRPYTMVQSSLLHLPYPFKHPKISTSGIAVVRCDSVRNSRWTLSRWKQGWWGYRW